MIADCGVCAPGESGRERGEEVSRRDGRCERRLPDAEDEGSPLLARCACRALRGDMSDIVCYMEDA